MTFLLYYTFLPFLRIKTELVGPAIQKNKSAVGRPEESIHNPEYSQILGIRISDQRF